MKTLSLRVAGWVWQTLAATVLLVLILGAAAVLTLRHVVLPDIQRYRGEIATALSRAVGQPLTLAAVQADWKGLWPRLTLQGIVLFDAQGQPALTLEEVDTLLSWQSVLVGELRLKRLIIDRPRLAIRREADGLIYISGIPVNRPGARAGLADWILRQGEIRIQHARLEWEDRLRGAPPLVLENVGLRLDNDPLLRRHRFGIVAEAPRDLAGPIDLRGDLRGRTFDDPAGWRGTLYARLPATDLSAWAAWVDFPYAVRRGVGDVQVWLDIGQGRVKGITADVALKGVAARLKRDLPELDLDLLQGRVAWQALPRGYQVELRRITAVGPDLNLPAGNLLFRYEEAGGGAPEKGRLKAEEIALAPLVELALRLPLTASQRSALAETSPRGVIRQLSLEWEGPIASPRRYAAQARLADLGVNAWRKLPGFTRLTGSVDLDEKGGNLLISGQHSAFDLPQVMRNPVGFDTLEVAASWRVREGRVDLTLSRAVFANSDAAGSLSGRYESVPGGPGWVDLTGGLTRANARAVHLYLPRVVGEATHDWLRDALLAGRLTDVRLRLKGDLAHFPFPDDREGLFQVTGRAEDVRLAYAEGWPVGENLRGNVQFRGARFMAGIQGVLAQVRIPRLEVTIDDLTAPEEILRLAGEAQGNAADVLRFINGSPVSVWMDHTLDAAVAEGPVRLALRLNLPLRGGGPAKLSGNLQFANNTLRLSPHLPVFRQVNGRLDFTEKSVTSPRIQLETLGGPATLAFNTGPEGTLRVTASGRATVEGARDWLPPPLRDRLKGGTGWSLNLALAKGLANFNVASDLVGLESTLPAPLNKAPGEARPLRLERRALDAREDLLRIDLGQVLSAQLARRLEEEGMTIRKGRVRLGGGAAATPVHDGVWVEGELPALDVDLWRAVLDGGGGIALPLAGVNLRVAALDVLSRRFHRVHLNAWSQGVQWQATVTADELEGEGAWRSHDGGRLTARLKRLVVPDPLPQPAVPPAGGRDVELPGLDVIADELTIAQLKLGRLELLAAKKDQDWRIEKLRLANPEAQLSATGLWQSWLKEPATRLRMELDVSDVGRFLARLGHPDRIRRGNARLKGEIAWRGGPAAFNLGTLSGNLALEAHSGQFLRIDPGLGKLLGLLSLQSLPRRLTLDFRDVFSEGFAFDNIAATTTIANGVLSTTDFIMQGPAAVVTISGTTDLVRETQNLRIRVVPALGEGVAVAGAFLGGPVVGVTAFLLQKLLKDPVGQMIAYEYQVTGTWADPQVTKVGQGPAGAPTREGAEGTRP